MSQIPADRKMVDVTEASQLTGKSPKLIAHWARTGKIAGATKVGSMWWVPVAWTRERPSRQIAVGDSVQQTITPHILGVQQGQYRRWDVVHVEGDQVQLRQRGPQGWECRTVSQGQLQSTLTHIWIEVA